MMIRALPYLVLLALAVGPSAGQERQEKKDAGKNARFEQFKQLAGEWVGKKDGMELRATYKVTAGGSAVVETIFPGTEHEMITVIHMDGDDLRLTHYCMLGNQPQMKADGKGDPGKIEFKFVKATNLKSPKEMHMHDATFTFVNSDTLRVQWTHCMDGTVGGGEVLELKRKKAEKATR
jgi:hypothetical protein